ncbi:MAG: hypothetical protein QME75_05665 [Deltaproteobacteria bacterium]|nr:hypothetical protein [Deltaproteobacteria bacterium]
MSIVCALLGHLWLHSQCARCGKARCEQHHLRGCTCINCGEHVHNWAVTRWSYNGQQYTFEKQCSRCRERTRSTEHVPFDKLILGKELTIS